MIPATLNQREPINCNWKVVMDAFQEGYHVQAVHPELIDLADLTFERFSEIGLHGACTVPFLATEKAGASAEEEVAMVRSVPLANFPGLAAIYPRFDDIVATYRGPDGKLKFPEGVTARSLLQRATRELWESKGLDVGALTDNQMSDYQFWSFFPNTFFQFGVGDVTFIQAQPHATDPNKCTWRVTQYIWAPPAEREAKRLPLTDVPEGQHVPYFLALEQDYEQMEAQQNGLKNQALEYIVLTKQEPRVAHLHGGIDRWVEGKV
jgi:phenylpropionate dioxygenase-like ring-hydroxylating dioxygenase large terminal subunit